MSNRDGVVGCLIHGKHILEDLVSHRNRQQSVLSAPVCLHCVRSRWRVEASFLRLVVLCGNVDVFNKTPKHDHGSGNSEEYENNNGISVCK